MSNYYILKFIVSDNDYYAERVTVSESEIEDLILDGVSFQGKNFNIVLKQHRGNVRNIIENIYGFPIVSQTIADVLLKHYANEIELFEVEVAKKITQKYYFVNILNVIDNCIDTEQSVYELFIPNVLIFKRLEKLVLLTNTINNNIFRIKSIRTEIIVSEAFKEKVQVLNMEELKFLPIEAYQED